MRMRTLALAFLLLAPLLAAQQPPGADAAPTEPAQRLLSQLSLEQRAAQLIFCFTYSTLDPDYARRDEIRQWLDDPGIGGVILSLGTAETAVALIDDLQRRAHLPLLLAADFEGGPGFRLDDASDFGSSMLLGATRSSRLAYQVGRMTAEESRAMGFHWNFAPVLDVNINPANPIIGTRSFSEDPALVARLGTAFVLGSQNAGVLATGKHFPGHGDVSVDSHISLPTVAAPHERLESVELVPFRAAIEAGLGSVMTGHLSVPALDDPGIPATMSEKILTGVLRHELGFDGIIVTDSLGMGALGEVVEDRNEAAVRALAAGADVLLMPPDPSGARDAVVAAVRSGRVPTKRLDEACLRVLRAKADAGLLDGAGMPSPDWRDVVLSAPHRELAAEIARRGTTIIRDPLGLVPLRAKNVVLVEAFAGEIGQRGKAMLDALANTTEALAVHRLPEHPSKEDRSAAIAAIRAAKDDPDTLVVCAVYPRGGRTAPKLDDVFQAVAGAPRAVVAMMGTPYATEPIGESTAYVCGYHDSLPVERAVAAVLAGTGPAFGRLPVTLPEVAKFGDGLSFLPLEKALPHTAPEQQGFVADLARRVRERLERGVADKAFPGAVALVARRGEVVAEVAVGHETYDENAPAVTTHSLYDLASLTKVCATTPTALRLIDRGELSLDTHVQDLLPGFQGENKDKVTIRNLLTHTAGLPPFRTFFKDLRGKAAILAEAEKTPLDYEPGTKTRYSDIGMMLLMACIEAVTKKPFDVVAREEVFEPLGMTSARFTTTGSPIDAVPTEIEEIRGGLVRGEVHDENAWAMGGVSGHAGLFADAEDVCRIGLAYLGGGRTWISPSLARLAIKRANVVEGQLARARLGHLRGRRLRRLEAVARLVRSHRLHRHVDLVRPGAGHRDRPAVEPRQPDSRQPAPQARALRARGSGDRGPARLTAGPGSITAAAPCRSRSSRTAGGRARRSRSRRSSASGTAAR